MDLTLSDEHAALRDSVAEFARDVVAPVIGGLYERGEFPVRHRPPDGRDGPVRAAVPRGARRHGRRLLRALPGDRGARPGRLVRRDHPGGRGLAGRDAHLPVRHAEQQAQWLPRLARGRGARRVRADRARRRLGRRRDPHHRPARRRRVGDQRRQGFITNSGTDPHRARHRDRGDRRARTAARRSRRSSSRPGRPVSRSSGVLQGRLGGARTPASCPSTTCRVPAENLLGERGPRLRAVPADPGRGPHRDRGAGGRARAGLRRRVGALRPGARRRSAVPSASTRRSQFQIADMEVRAHTARLAYYDAAARMLRGEPFKKEAAIAKLVASTRRWTTRGPPRRSSAATAS